MTERPLFRWQQVAQSDYLSKLQRDYLLVAVPGAGKTFWTLHTARELIRAGRISKILIVVPTRHVKDQWARTAHELGLDIEHDYRNRDGAWPRDADGVAMTYQQMYEQCSLHGKNVSWRPTLVVLDEVHHLEDKTGWGQAAQEAFDMAAYRIHLSGTPWNKNGYMPWVRYDKDGRAEADASYGYQESLTDGVNCDVFFPKQGGRAEWEFDGERFVHTFDEELAEADRARRLNTALALPGSDYIERTFRTADDELTRIRESGQDRAGGMVIAKDIDHADAIADLIHDRLHKPRPAVITSEKRGAADDLKAFRNNTDRWLVSVRMVSEGVDLPRLRVLVYATNITTSLFFRQAVGRVIRGPEPPALVFMPADPELLKWASEIRKERIEALHKSQEAVEEESPPLGDGEGLPVSLFRPVRAEMADAGVVHDDSEISQPELERAYEHIRAEGGHPDIPTATMVAKILRRQSPEPPASSVIPQQPAAEVPVVPLKSERKEALRRIQHKLVTAWCLQRGQDYKIVNARLNEAVGARRIRDCDEDQLRKRYELAKQWLT